MIKRFVALLLGLAVVSTATAQQETWEAGKNYFPVEPPQTTETSDKVEVLEVFSYACPACNAFQPFVNRIRSSLPKNAEMRYLPAAFRADEDWPAFQRAFFAAEALGILDKTHDATFDAVWKGGELKISDPVTHRPVSPMPTIEDIGKFYAKYGVTAEDFVGTANSFAVNAKMKRADAQIKAYGVDSTPTIIVNGKWRMTGVSAGGMDKLPALVAYLVAKESQK
jgi:thiol:disulfide interchange protein DsbA